MSEKGTVLRTKYKPNWSNRQLLNHRSNKNGLLRKVNSLFIDVTQFILPIGTKRAILSEARMFLKDNEVDCIIATGEPFVLFHYASILSKEFDIPWIADYRDPWTQSAKRSPNSILRKWNSFCEKKALSNCTLITTPSDHFKILIGQLVKNTEIEILPNGFDDKAIEDVSDIIQESDILTVSFVGAIYDWHPIELIFEVLDSISDQQFKFNFYGISNSEKTQDYY